MDKDMFIKQISMKNFRGFGDKSYDLKPGINLFIGPNASGKTSILEALSIAIGSFFLGIRGYDSRHIRPEDIRLSYVNDQSFEHQFPVEISALGNIFNKNNIQWSRKLNSEKGRTSGKEAAAIKAEAIEADNQVRAGKPITLPLLAYYGNGRLWLEPNESKKTNTDDKKRLSRFMGYHHCIDPRCSPRDMMQWMKNEEWISYKQQKETNLLSTVKKAIIQCLEDAESISFAPERMEFVVKFAYTDNKVPFSLLSDGQRAISAMVGDMAMRAARLNPHLGDAILQTTSGVVLIDEVDLYLHPKWQRKILRNLSETFPLVQFICTTHSPQVFGEVEPDSVINLDNDKHPSQSFGLDSNSAVLIMGGEKRNSEMRTKIDEIEKLIDDDKLDEAQSELNLLREALRGSDPDIAAMETIIENLKVLKSED